MERGRIKGARRLGLLGGTFDPPHIGHLLLAETARTQLALDAVLFTPVGNPPHKQGEMITAVSHRLAMCRLAIAGNPHFQLETMDAERPPPHYTATLFALLDDKYPDAAWWLIAGGDSLIDLPAWHNPEKIVTQCRLAILPRPGVAIDWEELIASLPGVDEAVDLLEGPFLHLSSTDLRRWRKEGRSLRYLMPTEVIDYIQQRRLYL